MRNPDPVVVPCRVACLCHCPAIAFIRASGAANPQNRCVLTDWQGLASKLSLNSRQKPRHDGKNLVFSRVFAKILGLALILPSLIPAAAQSEGVCDLAAQRASRQTGVPIAILNAITLAETGRAASGKASDRLSAWPWTVNTAGPGHWFDSRAEAEAFVAHRIARGERNIDIGCFQLNYRWHHGGFRNADAMFEPEANATYAAQFLARLYAETGDWRSAVGKYHSRKPERAEAYLTRLETLYRGQTKAPKGMPPSPVQVAERRDPTGPKPLRGAVGPLILRAVNPLPLIGTLRR